MSKLKTGFICSGCGFVLQKWEGCCPNCGEWNSLKEIVKSDETFKKNVDLPVAVSLKDINLKSEERYDTGIEDLNVVFGGGVVKGSISLIGGEPGIGKSTLILQICGNFCKTKKVFYISGEENVGQIKLRANRLKIFAENLFILTEYDVEMICDVILKEKPDIVIIDSIQTVKIKGISSVSGSVVQIRECTYLLQKIAKQEEISIILVGHVNKEGSLAGPKILEHIVDVVLSFEGDSKNSFRVLRGIKNRFGSINEIAVFDMQQNGLVCVKNPSAMLISQRPKNVSGSLICSVMQGKSPLFAEIQALAIKTHFGIARRVCKGLNYNKFVMIIAVLEKSAGFLFQNLDCFINVVGGIKLENPGTDLAVALSLVASLKEIRINENMVVLGEIGLAGEIRSVAGVERTILEAKKLGFNTIMLPTSNIKKLKNLNYDIELIGVETVKAAIEKMFSISKKEKLI